MLNTVIHIAGLYLTFYEFKEKKECDLSSGREWVFHTEKLNLESYILWGILLSAELIPFFSSWIQRVKEHFLQYGGSQYSALGV